MCDSEGDRDHVLTVEKSWSEDRMIIFVPNIGPDSCVRFAVVTYL